jgi:hypothetical protein
MSARSIALELRDRVKLRLHMDLARDDAAHAWVLNLYRAGEKHPETVDDYFPVRHADSPALAAQLERHANDERAHTRLYEQALRRMGQPVTELSGFDVFNQVIRAHTPVSFAILEDDDAATKRRRIGHFLVHAHTLEKRVARSLEIHLEACERVGKHEVVRMVKRVHDDELRHVASTLSAAEALFTRAELNDALEVHAHAEAAADRAFSSLQMRRFLREERERTDRRASLSHRALYRLGVFLMERENARQLD